MNLPDFPPLLTTAHKAPTQRFVRWGGVYGVLLHKTAHSGSQAEMRESQALLTGFLFLCAIMLPPLSPFSKNPAFLCQATVDPAKFVAVVSVEGNKTSNPNLPLYL